MIILSIINYLAIIILILFIAYLVLDIKNINFLKQSRYEKQGKVSIDKFNYCPDFFEIDGTKGKDEIYCKNVYKLGKCHRDKNSPISFNEDEFTDSSTYKGVKKGDYNKCLWAKACDVSWEGLDKLC
jgi:hypothetical protein